MRDLSDYNDKHLNEDIFIIGNGPQLCELSEHQIESLKNKVTIGVNYTHEFMDTTYWVCGHPGHMAYAIEYGSHDTIKFYQKHAPHCWMPEIWKPEHNMIPVLCTIFDGVNLLRRLPVPDGGRRIGIKDARQISFSAIHLSYIFGAKRIIFLGCDQNNLLHFFNMDKDTIERMRGRIRDVQEKYKRFDGDPDKEISSEMRWFEINRLNKSVGELRNMPWPQEHSSDFAQYFRVLNGNGVQVLSTEKNSVITRAGAPCVNLKDVL